VQLCLDAAIGSAARVVLAVTTAYRGLDADIFADWARTMHEHPLGEFYAQASRPDHLPGDLWFLKGIEAAYTAGGGKDFGSATFELLTNAVPMVADVLVGVLLFLIVRLWSSEDVAARADVAGRCRLLAVFLVDVRLAVPVAVPHAALLFVLLVHRYLLPGRGRGPLRGTPLGVRVNRLAVHRPSRR